MDERHYAAAAAAGDPAAFAALVRAHEGAVRRFLARLARGDADDLAQEVFLKAWRQAARYRGDGSYRGWLFRIAWTMFLDTRRGDVRRDAREAGQDLTCAATDPDLRLDLERALSRLPARERAAAALCFGEGCSHGEAAVALAMPLGTLKSVLARARAALTEQLETAHVR